MSSEVKNCPFCGGTPEFQESNPYDQSDDVAFTVFCRGCGTEHPWRDTPADAIAFWNRRALPAAPEPAEAWQPIDTAPMDGTVIYRRVIQPYRFLPYKANSQQAKRGERGRWQMMNEYGGWDNCPTPLGNEWRADNPFTSPSRKEAR